MINAYYTAKSGLLENQNSLNVTSNNIANVNTAGFKAESANFTDLLYTNIHGTNNGAPQNLQTGNGVKLSEVATSLAQSALNPTGRTLDAAIDGTGFFCTQDGAGAIHYTRAGSFSLSMENGKSYLVTDDGEYVLGKDMQRVEIPEGSADSAQFAAAGSGAQDTAVQLAVATFPNQYALTHIGNGKFAANDLTGQAQQKADGKIVQGSLENSNVDIATEMAKLIESQRGFQLSAKVLQIADELELVSNQLRT